MADIIKNFLFPKLFSMVQSGGRSSALKPLLCLAALSLVGMFLSPESLSIYGISVKGMFAFTFSLTGVTTLISYVILLFKNPRFLQSEHYQLAMRRMDIAAQQTGTPPNFVDTLSVAQKDIEAENSGKGFLDIADDANSINGVAAEETV